MILLYILGILTFLYLDKVKLGWLIIALCVIKMPMYIPQLLILIWVYKKILNKGVVWIM